MKKFSPDTKEIFLPLIFLFMLLYIGGCADENPALVNPSGSNDSIKVRFVNLTGGTRSLTVEGRSAGSGILPGASSILYESPEDSVSIMLSDGTNLTYQSMNRILFGKATVQTLIAMKQEDGRDTVVNFSAAKNLFIESQNALVRVLSAVPGNFSLRIGCPSGAPYVENFSFRNPTIAPELQPGKTVLALTRTINSQTETVGLYEIDLKANRYYALLVYPDNDQIKVSLLDEMNSATSALTPLTALSSRTAFVRAVNFSSEAVSINRNQTDQIVSSLEPGRISAYSQLSTCIDTSADRISLGSGAEVSEIFEVNQRYTILSADSGSGKANYIRIIPPVKYFIQPPDKASIRVVHLAPGLGSFSVSAGAQPDASDAGFRASQTIAQEVRPDSGYVSGVALLQSGEIPVTIFTSRAPIRLVMSTTLSLQAGSAYILVLSKNSSENIAASLINENSENQQVQMLEAKNFVQIINAIPDQPRIKFSLDGNFLSNANIFYQSSFATSLGMGAHTLSIGGITKNFILNKDSNYLVIASGSSANPDIFVFGKGISQVSQGTLERRFINVAQDAGAITVTFDNAKNPDGSLRWPQASDLHYGMASSFFQDNKEQRLSLYFWKQNDFSGLDSSQKNVPMPLGKQYSIIFTGSQSKKYSAIIQQEF